MEVLWIGAAVSVAFVGRMFTQQQWKSLATQLDFEFTGSVFGRRSVQGRVDGFGVTVQEQGRGGDRRSRLTVEVHGVDPGFTLKAESTLARWIQPDIETGDSRFDQKVRVEGDSTRAVALLGREARRLVELVVSRNSGQVADRRIKCPVSRLDDVQSELPSLLKLAKLLHRPSDDEIPALLARHALEDPSRSVRLRAFRHLVSEYDGHEVTVATTVELLESRLATLRLEAARLLLRHPEHGPEAVRVLAGLARTRRIHEIARRDALRALAGAAARKPALRDLAVEAMLAILDDPTPNAPEARRAAVEGLVRVGDASELLGIEPPDDPAEAEMLALALGRFDVQAQPRLLELLGHDADEVQCAAARSLGRVGDPRAVEPLRRLAQAGTLFKSATARSAEDAITKIQSRAGGSQAGEISLVQTAPLEGAVSPADDPSDRAGAEGGEVSLA